MGSYPGSLGMMLSEPWPRQVGGRRARGQLLRGAPLPKDPVRRTPHLLCSLRVQAGCCPRGGCSLETGPLTSLSALGGDGADGSRRGRGQAGASRCWRLRLGPGAGGVGGVTQ